MLIAITGGFGSGKSTVGAVFAHEGWRVEDLDAEVHRLYQFPASAFAARLRERWGVRVWPANGPADRAEIGRIVFGRAAEREFLNGLIHPVLRERLVRWRAAARETPAAVEVPLLFELGWETMFDAVAAVWAPRDLRCERLRNRAFDAAEFARREAAQLDPDRKLERADFGIVNLGEPALLEKQCVILIHKLMRKR